MGWLKAPLTVAPDFKYSHILAEFDFNLVAYMDDLLIVSYMSHARTKRLLRLLVMLFDLFGISINQDKSILSPEVAVDFLGFTVSATG